MALQLFCSHCQEETEHKHLYDAAHGIPEAYMAGSERYTCARCGNSLYKEEGAKLGLAYSLESQAGY